MDISKFLKSLPHRFLGLGLLGGFIHLLAMCVGCLVDTLFYSGHLALGYHLWHKTGFVCSLLMKVGFGVFFLYYICVITIHVLTSLAGTIFGRD